MKKWIGKAEIAQARWKGNQSQVLVVLYIYTYMLLFAHNYHLFYSLCKFQFAATHHVVFGKYCRGRKIKT